jgi:AcrR family transcriptional regulator
MSPRRRKAEDTDVFAAMVRVMLRAGPAELTLSAIVAEAGVTAGALVQRFGSKRDLLHVHVFTAHPRARATPTRGDGRRSARPPLGRVRTSVSVRSSSPAPTR